MLRNSLNGFILLAWSSTVLGQQAKLHIQAIPDNSVVLLDGDTLGSANDRTVYMGFNDRKGIDTHTVVVFAPDHEPFKRTYTLEMPKDVAVTVRLPRVLPQVSTPTEARVDWRPVVSGIAYGTELGAGTRWLYRFRKDVLDVQAKDELHQALVAMNLNLFDSLPDARQRIEAGDSARLMLQGLVESYTLRRGLRSEDYSSYYKAYTATVSVRWQLVDRENDSLLLDQPFASVYEYRGIATIGFHDAVVDNFYRFMQSDTALIAAFERLDKPRPMEPIGRFEEAEGDSGTVIDRTGKVVDLMTAPNQLDTMPSADSVAMDSVNSHRGDEPLDPQASEEAPASKNVMDLPIKTEATASLPAKKGPKRIISLPKVESNQRHASASIVASASGPEINEVGVVLAKGGLAVIPNHIPVGETIRLRFVNGVELDARVEATDKDVDLSLLKIDAMNLKAVLPTESSLQADVRYLLPVYDEVNKVGVEWSKTAQNELAERAMMAVPVFDAAYQWMGFQWPSSRFLDAQTVLNVLSISYE